MVVESILQRKVSRAFLPDEVEPDPVGRGQFFRAEARGAGEAPRSGAEILDRICSGRHVTGRVTKTISSFHTSDRS